MKSSRDPDVLIRAFIEEGIEELPDSSYDVVRASIERSRQRVGFGPWRTNLVTRFATYGIAAVAAVLIAVIGIRFLPTNGGIGVQPSPTPTTDSSSPPSASVQPLPIAGDLEAGRYSIDVALHN